VEIFEARRYHFLRKVRSAAYWCLEPYDFLFRRIIKLGHYPPIALRRHVSAGGFEADPLEFVAYLKLLLGLQEEHKIWDVGCGYGILALALESRGWKGNFVGTDIYGPCVWWAAKTISPRIPSFRFIHADIANQAYWPRGAYDAKGWFDHFPERDFDIVLAKSLFPHMLPSELDIYLQEISSRLKSGGKACLTFFLLNDTQRNLTMHGKSTINFIKPAADTVYAVRNLKAPSATVAYEEWYIREKLRKFGFREPDIRYGEWSGIRSPLSGQDLVLVQKE
jgi:SAM-dependent methyltransferase